MANNAEWVREELGMIILHIKVCRLPVASPFQGREISEKGQQRNKCIQRVKKEGNGIAKQPGLNLNREKNNVTKKEKGGEKCENALGEKPNMLPGDSGRGEREREGFKPSINEACVRLKNMLPVRGRNGGEGKHAEC